MIIHGFKERLGIPVFITVLVIIGEFFGSIALVVGLCTRFTACISIVIMLGAIFIGRHINNSFFMNYWNRQQGEGWKYDLLIIGASLALLFPGSGRILIDYIIRKNNAA